MRKQLVVYAFIVVALFISNVIVSQATFLTNISLASTAAEQEQLIWANKELAVKLAHKESVEILLSKARKMGFLNNSPILFLSPNELAKKSM